MDSELKIVVVYGGISTEREISLNSGKAVYEALKTHGYNSTKLFDLSRDNVGKLIDMKPDIVYLALHGKGGEDGSIQGTLELAGIPYTGPGVSASAICMNKIFTKHILKSANIPTADYLEYYLDDLSDINKISKEIIKKFGLPVVLKSPCQGSSIGVEIVSKESDMARAINSIFSYGNQMLVEEFLAGIEITLPIIGNEVPVVLPDIEITSEREFYDYAAKYTAGLCHHIIPSRISEQDRSLIREIGLRVYKEFELCGISRIDFIIDKQKGPMVIEINTLPGMTEMSLVPDAGRAAGISFDGLVSKILEYGLSMKRDLK